MILITNISEIEKEAESCDRHGEDFSIELRKLSTLHFLQDLGLADRDETAGGKAQLSQKTDPKVLQKKREPQHQTHMVLFSSQHLFVEHLLCAGEIS